MEKSRHVSFIAVPLAAAGLLLCAGCGGSKAAKAGPPPQSLSEPVRVAESTPDPTPAPVAVAEPAPRVGESRELPTFTAQEPAPPARIAPVAPRFEPAPAPVAGNRVHTLAKGETLAQLSRKYSVKLGAIIAANHFRDPNHLIVGTKVVIP